MTASMAAEQVTIWQHAVQVQSLRIVGEGLMGPTGPPTREVDAYLFAFALRNFIRAAEMFTKALDPSLAAEAQKARATFDKAVPRAVDLRDVLEHFDQYLIGKGKLQKGSSEPAEISHEVRRWEHVLRVVVRRGTELEIDVNVATAAANELAWRLSDLFGRQQNNDVLRRVRAVSEYQRSIREGATGLDTDQDPS